MRAAVSRVSDTRNHAERKKNAQQQACSRRQKTLHDILTIERLEDRLLFTATPVDADRWGLLSSHGNVCSCPLCTGIGLEQIPAEEFQPTGLAQAPLTSLPQLHSNASASAKLLLDF